jgi:hypothetical protein
MTIHEELELIQVCIASSTGKVKGRPRTMLWA